MPLSSIGERGATMSVRLTVRVPGPLEPYRDGFREALESAGYAPGPIGLHLALFSHLSGWLRERGGTVERLTAEVVEEFFEWRRLRYGWLRTSRSLRPLLHYLRCVGVVPPAPQDKEPGTALEAVLDRYRGYLVAERGLA